MDAADFEPDLVPELLVMNLADSLEFWCRLCGFEVLYDRPDERFAYVACGRLHLMLEQYGAGRNWLAGDLERPFGRGINLQMSVLDLGPILSRLAVAAWPLFMRPETKWYRVSRSDEAGVRQFVVADPDGYLVRFQSSVGRRSVRVRLGER